ncbi:MAG: RNase adapter RapZ [Lachnospiraceae bacterium]|nr:RNase adapter RapZ [Lachnospiraceae bacterium]MDD7178844.1 RNase adapter RapZ [bacterium]MDY5516311.1 RNase adapter RapZ [Lachnospiraceae bacterium]
MRCVILTGMSGSGKSTALKMIEDMGYYCVGNLPISLVESFAELAENDPELEKVAINVDIRSGQNIGDLTAVLDRLQERGKSFEMLFLESEDSVIIKRYKETRRSHPLAEGGRVDRAIQREREQLKPLKRRADYILDTSQLLTRELQAELKKMFVENQTYKNLYITVLSFGFKYGIPTDADLVFDVRFLPNPYYVEGLRPLTGLDKPIQDYVSDCEQYQEFLDKLEDMIKFLIPNYISEGKNQLVIAIGCTGGKHRSVTVAQGLYDRLGAQQDYGLRIEHRDIKKDNYLAQVEAKTAETVSI